MAHLGVMEIFFGPPWNMDERLQWADFLSQQGLSFYLYGPKSDACLRKRWLEPWPPEYLTLLGVLAGEFRMRGLQFGVALSPFGLDYPVSQSVKDELRIKISALTSIGVEILGLFFDDMKTAENLADMQLEILAEIIATGTGAHILFCPSYYSLDPVLDKVFGPRPLDYLERLGREIPQEVDILWTGPKVISTEISVAHLRETALILRRKPFVCDNLFANDGPRNCKFLKLREFSRETGSLAHSAGWALNPMNQAALSQAMVLSARKVFEGELPSQAFDKAARELWPPPLANWILERRQVFLSAGLDQIGWADKTAWIKELEAWPVPVAREIARWLNGEFQVGEECLTD
jgi:hyaluronoglucosaminidase